jgi:hypothetical protein
MDQELEDRLTNIEREQEAARSILTDYEARLEVLEGHNPEYLYGFSAYPKGKPWQEDDNEDH